MSEEIKGCPVELDGKGEAMMCEGCGSTLTIAAILERHGPKAIACCPERKMVPARWYWERACVANTRAHDGDGWRDIESLTRPIIGIQNRTAQEAFDIMCDRIRHVAPPQSILDEKDLGA